MEKKKKTFISPSIMVRLIKAEDILASSWVETNEKVVTQQLNRVNSVNFDF